MEQYRLDFNDYHAMEKATWILTHKESKEVITYNREEMSKIVEEAYVQYHNETYSGSFYNEPKLNNEDIRVEILYPAACHIFRRNRSDVVGAGYDQILPQYDIECYGYLYQCKECKRPLKERKKRGHKKPEGLFCLNCVDIVEVY